jgi:hypothetical protein
VLAAATTSVAISAMAGPAAPSSAQGTPRTNDDTGTATGRDSTLSERATDPTQSPLTFGFSTIVTTHSYASMDGTEPDTPVDLEFQPVIPFTVWGLQNILRLTMPYQLGRDGPSGLDDVQIFDLLVFGLPIGRLGAGAVANLSGQEKDASAHASIGPALGLMSPVTTFLNVGIFSQNVFASGIAISSLQPIAALELGSGWSLSNGDMEWIYDWHAGAFAEAPVQLELGKLFELGEQSVRFAVAPTYNFKELAGAYRLQLAFTLELIVLD